MNHTTKSLLTLALLAPLVALAQGATVVTKEGVGEEGFIPNTKQEQEAFEKAKDRALRNAVEQAAGVRIDADTTVVNNQLVRDQIFANTTGYVKKFEVVEKKVEKNVITVKVKADIITENLDKDIAAARDLVKRIGRPSLLVLINEQTLVGGGKAVANSEALAAALTEKFKADGWTIIDEQAINKSMDLHSAISISSDQIKKISELAKVDYVLYGKASVRQEEKGEMFKNADYYPISGEYDLTLAATDTASQIAKMAGALRMSPTTKETGVSYERTALRVINEKRDEIITPVRRAVLEHFRDQEVNGRELNVSVKGLESMTSAKEFLKAVATITGVKDSSQQKFGDGTASYRVTYLGSADDFAVKIEAATFKKKKLTVVSQTANQLEVQVAK
ncbi:MAG: hypothetical protein U0228_12255 [Myxococcaceae bacterium]